ncbi:MAG: hypothetical protein AAGC74_03400 [Verrucomicrobiota bacterium]
MSGYELYLRQEALENLRGLRGRSREVVRRFVESLKENPETLGDFRQKDETMRDIEVKIVGGQAVFYWADHAVKEVKVVDIQNADRV